MFNFKNKIVVVGLLCVMPTYVMGKCYAQLQGQNLIGICDGQQTQIQLTSPIYELLKKNTSLRKSIGDNADSLEELRTNASSILIQVTNHSKQTMQQYKKLTQAVETNTRLLHNKANSRQEKQRLNSTISRLKLEISSIGEENSQELYQVYQNHKEETSYLEAQLRNNINNTYQVKEQLFRAKNRNKNLESFIYSATDTFSSSLASSFLNYSECIKKSDLLSTYTFAEIHENRNKRSSSNGFFSSSNSSSISSLPRLSSSGISSSSLGSCANEFRSLRKRFTLYEVALNLFMNSDARKRGVVANFFQVYKGITPSENTITRFIQAFNNFPKNGLLGLIKDIDAEMRKY